MKLLITGASRGIGLELTRQAAMRGDEVIACARRPKESYGLQEAHRDFPLQIQTAVLDVTDPDQAGYLAASLEGAPIDLLICNAGLYQARGGIEDPDYTPAAWAEVMAANVAGPFFTIRAFLPNLEAAGGKAAIISSRMGSNTESTSGNSYIYRASKAAATNLASNLARDLAPRGVAVGAYHPGWVSTDMGGAAADVSVKDSAIGLLSRFDALSPETTGVFEDFAGTRLAF